MGGAATARKKQNIMRRATTAGRIILGAVASIWWGSSIEKQLSNVYEYAILNPVRVTVTFGTFLG